MNVSIVAGARPNFIKISPIVRAIKQAQANGARLDFRIIHTGQHYDDKLSRIFFEQLGIPSPDVNLGAGSGSQAEQTAKIMIGFEKDLISNPADLVLVVGDVTSTLACAIVAKKLNVRVAHVEAGIRSNDITMPEEINRLVTDSISDFFFTTSQVANTNLRKSGVSPERIFFVGNMMIDSLNYYYDQLAKPPLWHTAGLVSKDYFVLTLHRPSNVDNFEKFSFLLNSIGEIARSKIVFPVHPRAKKALDRVGPIDQMILTDPLSYFEFVYLLKESKGVITDSGGVQEETTVLGIPCLTLRNNTERPETVSVGTNILIGDDIELLKESILKINDGKWKDGSIPELWDGRAAERTVQIIRELYSV